MRQFGDGRNEPAVGAGAVDAGVRDGARAEAAGAGAGSGVGVKAEEAAGAGAGVEAEAELVLYPAGTLS